MRSPFPRSSLRASAATIGIAVALSTVALPPMAAAEVVSPALSVDDCSARPTSNTTVTGDTIYTSTYRQLSPAPAHTFDLRGATFRMNQDALSPTFNKTGAVFGDTTVPSDLCVIGGTFVGGQSRDLDWEYLKHDPGNGDYPAVRTTGAGLTRVEGIRTTNVMNAVSVGGGSHAYRNIYADYIRDDCLTNDLLLDVKISDSLFDGCYVAFSQRPDRGSPLYGQPRDTSVLELDGVLVRMVMMPGGHGYVDPDPSVKTHDHIWKWSDVSGAARIRNSIIVAEDPNASLDWPANVTAENVTVVWLGAGAYPGRLPATGVTVTKDISVWTSAKATWLARHGCTSSGACDATKMVHPDGDGDTVAPTVALTSPTAGSNLSGTVTVSAQAGDAQGVARVEVYDGTTLLGADTTSPYTVSWDTAGAANGAHTLTGKAYDAAGNTATSAPVQVTVKNVRWFRASQDTVVREGRGGFLGQLDYLEVRDGNDQRDSSSFIRFDVTDVVGPANATLRMFTTDSSPEGGNVHATRADWDEDRLTWATQPVPTSARLASLGMVTAGRWIEIDLGPVILGPGSYAFALSGGVRDRAVYGSRESLRQPQLVVTPQ